MPRFSYPESEGGGSPDSSPMDLRSPSLSSSSDSSTDAQIVDPRLEESTSRSTKRSRKWRSPSGGGTEEDDYTLAIARGRRTLPRSAAAAAAATWRRQDQIFCKWTPNGDNTAKSTYVVQFNGNITNQLSNLGLWTRAIMILKLEESLAKFCSAHTRCSCRA
ncbi:hypothetical protein ACP4OV_004156 [Aristida adscensionis]